jgi:L-rhamnose isomerase
MFSMGMTGARQRRGTTLTACVYAVNLPDGIRDQAVPRLSPEERDGCASRAHARHVAVRIDGLEGDE